MLGSKFEEEALIGLMTDIEDTPDLDAFDEKVDLFDIYSLREAYHKLTSYNEHIIFEYKALKRKFNFLILNWNNMLGKKQNFFK